MVFQGVTHCNARRGWNVPPLLCGELRLSRGAVRRAKLAGELAPQQFPDGGLGQRLPKLYALRNLVRGEVSPAVVADLLLGQAHAFPRDHPGHHSLSRMRVRDPRDADLSDGGVCRDDFFDLARPNLKTARLDEILLAIDDGEIPVPIEQPQIASIEPAVAQHFRGRLRIVPVAFHQLRRLDDDLADLAGSDLLARIIDVHDSHVDIGQRDADRALLVGAHHGRADGGHAGLGQRVHFDDPPARQLTGGRIIEVYSLTEACMASVGTPVMGTYREGAVGIPLPDVDVRIVDVDDPSQEVGPGEIGEIVIAAPQLMEGYWHNPEATKEMLRDGRLYTGDLGSLDGDGYLTIADRKKDLIKASGFQVWPREVEEVIATHAAVAEVGVAGVPDAHSGEAVMAWVVTRKGMGLTEEEIRDHCR